MKNTIYIIVIVLCIILAIIIFLKSRPAESGGIKGIKRGEMLWVKCNNPNCAATYQMDKKDYYEQMQEKMKANPLAQNLPLVCKECGEDSIYRAVKCEKCGTIFFYQSVPHDFADRCPECNYSKMEAERKARARR